MTAPANASTNASAAARDARQPAQPRREKRPSQPTPRKLQTAPVRAKIRVPRAGFTAIRASIYAPRCAPTRIARVASVALFTALAALAFFASSPPACAARYAFAVVSGALSQQIDETAAQKLIEAIDRTSQASFIVYDGNLKGAREACIDALYARRRALLAATRNALVFVPGRQDWVSCASPSVDPVERLDLLRQTFFADSSSLGQRPLTLTRESEVARFRPYRENVRWLLNDTVFVALNLPGENNHYLNAGGRNGEFDDRAIANAFWLDHAAEYAKRRNARAIVIFTEADPFAQSGQRAGPLGWLRLARRPRDGYLEFRRSLVKLAAAFRGPVILVHASEKPLPARGFLIDQPLRDDKGEKIPNLTRIAFGLRAPLAQWLQIDVDTAQRPPLKVSVRDAPKFLPPPQFQPPTSNLSEMPDDMPQVTTIPDASTMPPAPDATGALPVGNAGGTRSPEPIESGTPATGHELRRAQ